MKEGTIMIVVMMMIMVERGKVKLAREVQRAARQAAAEEARSSKVHQAKVTAMIATARAAREEGRGRAASSRLLHLLHLQPRAEKRNSKATMMTTTTTTTTTRK